MFGFPDQRSSAGDRGAVVLRRVRRRLIPFAFLCYVVAYIDRVNVGFAARELQRDLGLSSAEYGVGAGLFFLGYCLFEIPSNLLLERVGARRWIARIMIGWGIVSVGTMFVHDVTSFMTARVLLGIAEAGFFPGMVLYLTHWIPAADRARAGALFMMAAPVAVIVGAPLSEAILGLNGTLGLTGWQWLFLIEGLPAVVLGLLTLEVMTDGPERATWLTPDDRRWLSATMTADRAARDTLGHTSMRDSFASPRVWLLCSVFFLNSVVNYGMFLWLPRLLGDLTGTSGLALSAITIVPFVASLAAMLLMGRHSDRTGERRLHVAACVGATAIGLLVAVVSQQHLWSLVFGFTIAQMGLRSFASVFWAIPPQILGGRAAAPGIALINSIGNFGGFVGPSVIGLLHGLTGSYTGGLLALIAALAIEVVLVLAIRLAPAPQLAPLPTTKDP